MVREDAESIYRKKKSVKKDDLADFRKKVREKGPIWFAENYLRCPPNVPSYPNWEALQEEYYCEGCEKVHKKFLDNGIPYHVILSEGQKETFIDAWLNGVRLILVSAGRGAGKTFGLAVWDCWRLVAFDYYEITCMGGSAEQSKKIQKYIDFWRINNDKIGRIIHRSPKAMGNRRCITITNSECSFIACSPTAAMGAHVDEVQIDEACAAESKGQEGREAIEAVDWQTTGRRDSMIWMTSTSHFLLGRFNEILSNPKKFGFKTYIWGIAKHISGKAPNKMYEDSNPKHWVPALWWMTEEEIRKKRKAKSNEEWLCWALGYPSLASGQLYKQDDMKIITCDICERQGKDCRPYEWGHCVLIERFQLGDEKDTIKNVRERKAGFDYGDPAPCALVVGGRRIKLEGENKGKPIIFVLYADEQKGLASAELYDWITGKLELYKVEEFNPDPSIGGKHASEKVDEAGFAVNILDEQAKEERVLNSKVIVERHAVVIPVAFYKLLTSMKQAHRDQRGKIVKYNDHSFDAFCYLCCDWGDMEANVQDVFDAVLEELGLKTKDGNDRRVEAGGYVLDIPKGGLNFWD
jgi:hypothetical protein